MLISRARGAGQLVAAITQTLRGFASGGSRQDGLLPRLYKNVAVQQAEQGWVVMLDGRQLKTPGKNNLVLPTQTLAMAIAAEWEYQDARSIRPFTMPLMSLAATAIDQPKPRELVIGSMMEYLHTDSLCLREEDHRKLSNLQDKIYAPVFEFYEKDMKLALKTTTAIFGVDQSPETTEAIKSYMNGLDSWDLACLESLSAAARSVLIGVAQMHGIVTPESALKLARLEENYQMEEWGLVEGGHDIDEADYAVRVTAPLVFQQFLKE